MGDKELEKFRLLWREEIRERNRAGRLTCGERSSKKRRQQPGPCDHGDRVAVEGPSGRQRAGAAHDYFHLAQSLLEGRSSPLRERLEDGRCGGLSGVVGRGGTGTGSEAWAGPQGQSTQDPSNKKENLLDQLINDLNEINEIPFFDIDLPYELALKIFAYLGKTELGRCAQVSKAWKVIAEDEVLWYKHCLKAGYQAKADIGDFVCWKAVMRDSIKKEQTLQANWKTTIDLILNKPKTEELQMLEIKQEQKLLEKHSRPESICKEGKLQICFQIAMTITCFWVTEVFIMYPKMTVSRIFLPLCPTLTIAG